ncbi:hypothetical protein MOV08_05080 [Streptomyces yunnanensis]|uniref:Uncharacterized protein n=1 Tax=Streptomyces yunnanensis TaxID=156453 RepID=A0ABY8A352_9ACTN|nr:hypothetical protein [Streptomyces yunnanensis]WEB38736.1 hypothetical protein MOV08_05080 [Streptomyces yunnanensis]
MFKKNDDGFSEDDIKEFAEYLNSVVDAEEVTEQVAADALAKAARVAILTIAQAGEVKKAALEAGLSHDLAEGLASDFWTHAMGGDA